MGTDMEIVDIDDYSIDDDNINMLNDSFDGLDGRFLEVEVEGVVVGVVIGVGGLSMGWLWLVGGFEWVGLGNYSSLFICVEVIYIYSTAIEPSNIFW